MPRAKIGSSTKIGVTPMITIRVFSNDEEDASLCLLGANETIMEDIVIMFFQ